MKHKVMLTDNEVLTTELELTFRVQGALSRTKDYWCPKCNRVIENTEVNNIDIIYNCIRHAYLFEVSTVKFEMIENERNTIQKEQIWCSSILGN